MKIIWTFTLLMIPGVVSSMRVSGYSGGGVRISCKYDEGYKRHEKYFCKGRWPYCTYQIRTKVKNKWVKKDRFSLYDDTSSAVYIVTFRDLSEEDSGTYFCGTGKTGLDSYTEVNLEVLTDQPIRRVRGYSGGNVIINFKYEEQEETPLIDICKSGADQCFPVINTNRAAEWKHGRRFSVHEDRSAGLFRVFIRELNENDSGGYKIIVEVSEDYSFFSKFNLNIEKDDCVKSISLSAAAGGSVSISCKYPQSHSSDVKFLCWRSGADLCAEETSVNESRRWRSEGKIQLYDDREERLLTGSISRVTEQHSEYWCGVQSDEGHKSFITRVLINLTGSSLIVSLVLLLVLIIAGLSLLFLCKKRQSPGADSSSQTGPGKHEVVSHTGCDYEEIKDTHKPLPTNPSDSSDFLYATAQLPTNPSDSSACVYATAQLPTNPSNSSDFLYATAQLPTNPSNSSDFLYATAQLPTNPSDSSACVYATVQKAAGDSQCFITSAEDLNYAVVNFHKKSDCPVSVRNNQDYSEYAAVNHLSA